MAELSHYEAAAHPILLRVKGGGVSLANSPGRGFVCREQTKSAHGRLERPRPGEFASETPPPCDNPNPQKQKSPRPAGFFVIVGRRYAPNPIYSSSSSSKSSSSSSSSAASWRLLAAAAPAPPAAAVLAGTITGRVFIFGRALKTTMVLPVARSR